MRYCINPNCQHRENNDSDTVCQGCQNNLVIKKRYILRQPLRPLGFPESQNFEVFSIYDLTDEVEKVLKTCVIPLEQYQRLLQVEAEILIQLRHPGIPKSRAGDYFDCTLNNGEEIQCLLMEKIEGSNLETWIEAHGKVTEDKAINWLKQILDIINFIHNRDFFHRDIKPANIILKPDNTLVLIDFGTAREVTQTVVSGQTVTRVCSAGYTAPEQMESRAKPQSDFFALGRTFVHLLTGKPPQNYQGDFSSWRNDTLGISNDLANLIDDLMNLDYQKRPQNTAEIQQRLAAIKPSAQPAASTQVLVSSDKKIQYILIGLLPFLGILGYLTFERIKEQLYGSSKINQPTLDTCDRTTGDNISCGEESLFANSTNSDKKQGIQYFKDGNYQEAINSFKNARNHDPADPEILVYLNNARLGNSSAYNIPIVLPINEGNRELSQEILRGIAQFQNEVNQNRINGQGFRILVVSDTSDRDDAIKVAQLIVKKKDILAVIGHYNSEMTLKALPIYQQHKLVMISYGSTSRDLTVNLVNMSNNWFFRVVPNVEQTKKVSMNELNTNKRFNPTGTNLKLAILYNSSSSYSKSIAIEFKEKEEQLFDKLNLDRDTFNAESIFQEIKGKGFNAIALFPDGNTSSNSQQNSYDLIRANNKQYQMLTAWGLGKQELLQEVGKYVDEDKLVIAHVWHRLDNPSSNEDYLKNAEKIYGKKAVNADRVSGLSALSYDAGIVLQTALLENSNPSPEELRNILADRRFQATGATGKISFDGSDRRENPSSLLQIVRSKNCNNFGYSFAPISYKLPKDGILQCQN